MHDEIEDQEWPPEKEKSWFFYAETPSQRKVASFFVSGTSAESAYRDALAALKKSEPDYIIKKMTRV